MGAVVGVGDNVEEMIARRKPALAFQLGGMGSPKTNFYNQAYRRIGYEDVAVDVQQLWVAGKREEAVARIPDEMALQANVIGTADMVQERLREYAQSGIDILQLQVMGRDADAPAVIRMLLDSGVPREYLASATVFRAASAPLDPATAEEFEDAYGIPVITAYGATEFLGAVTGFTGADLDRVKEKRGSVGRALPRNAMFKVLAHEVRALIESDVKSANP